MFLLQSKPVHFFVAFVFVEAILCVSYADGEDAVKKDVKNEAPKDPPKEDDNDDTTKQDSEPEDSEDRPKTPLEEEAEYIFLTDEEAKDFLGIGPMFEDPEHHKFLLGDYVTMDQSDYWEQRCDEMSARHNNTKDDSASFEKPPYCA